MAFPFEEEIDEDTITEQEIEPLEYGIDFSTGKLTGKMVKGLEAIKVWIWLAIQTERYKYPIFSWDYGCELEDLIGKGYSHEYITDELERMIPDAISVVPYVTEITDLIVEFDNERITATVYVSTSYGNTEVSTNV